ncbi:MAG TPA: hypothetical protein VGC97_22440 [Pyrinomonadaceae bacterium]|jgi:hypothetical protein
MNCELKTKATFNSQFIVCRALVSGLTKFKRGDLLVGGARFAGFAGELGFD